MQKLEVTPAWKNGVFVEVRMTILIEVIHIVSTVIGKNDRRRTLFCELLEGARRMFIEKQIDNSSYISMLQDKQSQIIQPYIIFHGFTDTSGSREAFW